MINKLFPTTDIDSSYDINYEALFEAGYRGIIYDIDNTLVTHGAPANEKALELFRRLHAIGYKTVLLSNNKEPRVKSFAQAVEAEYIFKAGKPSKKGYLCACEKMQLATDEVFFVGDQLFTDILGANNAGLYSILVKPIHPKEEIQIVLKRILEKPILAVYRWRKKHVK